VNNSLSVELNPVFKRSFNKNVFYTTGKKIYLRISADNGLVETITGSGISGSGINVFPFFAKNTKFQFDIG